MKHRMIINGEEVEPLSEFDRMLVRHKLETNQQLSQEEIEGVAHAFSKLQCYEEKEEHRESDKRVFVMLMTITLVGSLLTGLAAVLI